MADKDQVREHWVRENYFLEQITSGDFRFFQIRFSDALAPFAVP
jgi:hypothetical protein